MNNKSIELAHAVEEWAKADACVAENGWEATFNGAPVECAWDEAKAKMTTLAKEVLSSAAQDDLLNRIYAILTSDELCAEAMVSEIGEIFNSAAEYETTTNRR